MILSNVKAKLLWWIFCKYAKNWKWHKAAAVFVLNWRHKTGVGASTCVSQIYMFQSCPSVCCPSFCVDPLGEKVTPRWVANTLVVSTILLLCYAKSCFLQQEISTFWPNSSKHLLCPLMLEGPISSVYHLLLLLPPHYFGPTFCQLPFLFGSKRNIQESLLNIGIMFCFWFHLNLKLLRVTYFVWCQALRNKTATFDNLKLATK